MEIESLNHIVTPEQYERLAGIRVKSCWSCGNAAVISLASSCACCSDSICHASEEWIPVVAWNRRAEPAGLRELVWRNLCELPPQEEPQTNDQAIYCTFREFNIAFDQAAEVALADTEPSVPQPQSKTQRRRLVAQGAIEPSVPVSLSDEDWDLAFQSFADKRGFCLDERWGTDERNPYENPDTALAYDIWLAAKDALITEARSHE